MMFAQIPPEWTRLVLVTGIAMFVSLVVSGCMAYVRVRNSRKPAKPIESGEKKPGERVERLILKAEVWSYLFRWFPRTAVALCQHNIRTAVMTTNGRRIKLSFDTASWNIFAQSAVDCELDREQAADGSTTPCLLLEGTPEICFKQLERYPVTREMFHVRQIPNCQFMADAVLFGSGPYQAPRRVSLRTEAYTLFIKSCGTGGCKSVKKDIDEFMQFTPTLVWLANTLPVLAPPSQPLDKP